VTTLSSHQAHHTFLSNNSSLASRTVYSQPRPLHIEKKLSEVAKEDSVAYALFVEGMTLLVWDIAWICKTQGLSVGDNSWEEVCAMGRNLWQLLAAASPVPRPPILRQLHPPRWFLNRFSKSCRPYLLTSGRQAAKPWQRHNPGAATVI